MAPNPDTYSPLLAVSILGADWLRLGEAVEAAEKAGVDLIQIDVADGHFAPSITFGEELIKRVKEITELPIEVHLMVTDPEVWISPMRDLEVEVMIFHAEAVQSLHSTIVEVKTAGLGVGVALNIETAVDTLRYVLPEIDLVTLLSVPPGFAGQRFVPKVLSKASLLQALIADTPESTAVVEVDGGVNSKNVAQVIASGADVVVASSALYASNDITKATDEIKTIMAQVRRDDGCTACLRRYRKLVGLV
jgi:ribulose-phosphate 3-epimerase